MRGIKSNKEWQDEVDELYETEPNYKALMYCILHKKTADDALREMGVYERQRQPHQNEIDNNPYVKAGRKNVDKFRILNV